MPRPPSAASLARSGLPLGWPYATNVHKCAVLLVAAALPGSFFPTSERINRTTTATVKPPT